MSGDEICIETRLGRLIGETAGAGERAVHVFKGIPYAVPPVGVRRWKPAEPAPAWNCTRRAISFSPACVQPTEPEGTFFFRPQEPQSEDCLYLNVWTPGPAGRRPVMVYIHGGSFTMGSGSMPGYDGAALARRGVVVVTINYRLGVFGYFAHPGLVDEAGADGVCANFGTTDQIEALRWVRDNIEAFGGDPGCVTIFGESAGSLSVSQLMASPLAKGLFHRAIGQSGAYFHGMPWVGRPGRAGPPAEAMGAAFAKRIGAPSLADLRALSARELLAAVSSEAGALINGGALIAVDGKVFRETVHDTFLKRGQHPLPVLVGFNADEASGIADYGLVPAMSAPEYEAEARARFRGLAGEFLSVYPPDDPIESAFASYRDDMFGWGMVEWAEAVAASAQEAYLYCFTHVPPGAEQERPVFGGPYRRRVGAFHGADIGYVFDNMNAEFYSPRGDGRRHDYTVGGPVRPADRDLARAMADYWVAFAKTGAPRVAGLPEWRPYSREARDFMNLCVPPQPQRNLFPGMWEVYSKVNAARREAGILGDFYALGLRATPLSPD